MFAVVDIMANFGTSLVPFLLGFSKASRPFV